MKASSGYDRARVWIRGGGLAFHDAARKVPGIGPQIDLVGSMLVAFLLRVFGAGITFAMTLFVVKAIGADQAGYFYLGISLVAMLATVGNFGLEFALLRFAGAAAAADRWSEVRSLANVVALRCGLGLAILAAIMMLFSSQIAHYIFRYTADSLAEVFFTISPAIVFLGLSLVGAYLLQSIRRTKQAAVVFSIATPSIMVLGIRILKPVTANQMAGLYVVATAVAMTFAVACYWRALRDKGGRVKVDAGPLVRTGRALWGGIIANQLLINNGQLIAGLFLLPHDVTVFAVAQRVAMLLNFILVAVNFVVAPRYAALHETNDRLGLAHLAVFSTRLATMLSLPLALIMICFPIVIMHIFKLGSDAALVLAILGIGQFLTAIGGTSGVLLDMTGHEHFHRRLIIATTLLSVLLLMALTPVFGVVGSAIAMTIGLGTQNIVQTLKARTELGLKFIPKNLLSKNL